MNKTIGRVAATAGAFAVAGVAATVLRGRLDDRRKQLQVGEVEFGSVHGDDHEVVASDGVSLHVEIDAGPAPTIVFVHGWMCDLDTWHFQRLALRDETRMVFVDLRSHGRSGKAPEGSTSIAQLADDLGRVLREQVPSGPVVLVGHSMGAMAIIELAAQDPDLFGEQITGVVLIGTSSGKVLRGSPGLRHVTTLIRASSPLLDWGRGFNSFSVISRWAVGPDASPAATSMANEMILRSPSSVISAFYHNFVDLDLRAGLPTLGRCRVAVVCGTKDLITPIKHSQKLAKAIAGAEMVAVNNAGHLVMFEEPEQVTEAIERVLKDVR